MVIAIQCRCFPERCMNARTASRLVALSAILIIGSGSFASAEEGAWEHWLHRLHWLEIGHKTAEWICRHCYGEKLPTAEARSAARKACATTAHPLAWLQEHEPKWWTEHEPQILKDYEANMKPVKAGGEAEWPSCKPNVRKPTTEEMTKHVGHYYRALGDRNQLEKIQRNDREQLKRIRRQCLDHPETALCKLLQRYLSQRRARPPEP